MKGSPVSGGGKDRPRAISPGELRDPLLALALGLGSGLSPVAPGTAGTLAIMPLLAWLQGHVAGYLVVTAVLLLSGSWLCGYAARKLGVHDHPAIVYDEWAGMFISLLAVPPAWQNLLAGFFLFRFFDALKPWPIRWFDRHVHGGFGIMLDDVLAGLASLACVQLLLTGGLL